MASKKKKPNLRKQVRRDVRAAYKPVLQGLGTQKDIAKQEAERDVSRVGSIYDNLASTFNPLNKQFQRTANQLMAGTGQALSGLGGGAMEGGLQELLGAMGGSYAATLGTGMQGTLGNIAGLQAGALANRADIETNVMNRYRDFVNDLRLQRTDVKGQRAQTFLDELNRRRELRLAQREQQLRAEQFDKEFKFGKKQVKKEDRKERQGQRTVSRHLQDEKADKQAKKTLRRTKPKVQEIKADLASLKTQLAGTDAYAVDARAAIQAKIDRLEKRLAELQRKRKSARKERRD